MTTKDYEGLSGRAEEKLAGTRASAAGIPLWEASVLVLILLTGLVRGLFWVVITEVPNPVDEAHHLAYIESIATGRGIPRVGVDQVSREILHLIKDSRTWGALGLPFDPQRPEQWGAIAQQYEAAQPPLFYLLMAPFYRIGRLWGTLGALYTLRVASVLVSLAAIPVSFLLARRLFPRFRPVWLLSPLMLVTIQGFNANLASISNDALLVPISGAALLALTAVAGRPSARSSLVAGGLTGLAMLTKLNSIVLITFAVAALLILRRNGSGTWKKRIMWTAQSLTVTAAVFSPWLLWNWFAYGSPNGAGRATSALLAPLTPSYPLTLAGIGMHIHNARSGLWLFERQPLSGQGPYVRLYEISVVLAFGLSFAFFAVRARRPESRSLLWLSSCWPLALLSMTAIVYFAFTGSVVGRHTYPALVALAVLLAAATYSILPQKWGVLTCLAFVVAALFLESAEYRDYVERVYLTNLIVPGVGPAVEQPRNEGWVQSNGLEVRSRCPVRIIGIGLKDTPAELVMMRRGKTTPISLVSRNGTLAHYAMAPPFAEDFTVQFPTQSLVGGAREDHLKELSFVDRAGEPMAEIQCGTSRPVERRFKQMYDRYHSQLVSYGGVMAWGRSWMFAGGSLFLCAVVVLVLHARHRGGKAL